MRVGDRVEKLTSGFLRGKVIAVSGDFVKLRWDDDPPNVPGRWFPARQLRVYRHMTRWERLLKWLFDT